MPSRKTTSLPPDAETNATPATLAARVRPRTRPNSITVVDVAHLAGVSAMTVSRAINKPDSVPPATLAKVQEAVRKTGYVPNLLAGGLRSQKSRLVAALVPTLQSPVFGETVQALTAALDARGYQLMLGQTGYEKSREDDLLSAIIGRRPDGIVLTGVEHSAETRQRLLASGIPVVEMWDLSPSPIDMLVGFSHEAVSTAVCQYLHQRGRREIGVISGNDHRAQRRSNVVLSAAKALGLPRPSIFTVPAPTSLASGRTGLKALLAERPNLDALLCSSDLQALGVLTEAQAQGIAIPERIAVVGFGDLAFASDLHPALTTVRIDGTRIGREAARCLVDQVEGLPVTERVIDVGFSIIERASS